MRLDPLVPLVGGVDCALKILILQMCLHGRFALLVRPEALWGYVHVFTICIHMLSVSAWSLEYSLLSSDNGELRLVQLVV